MYYSNVEIEYVAMSFSSARRDLAVKLLRLIVVLLLLSPPSQINLVVIIASPPLQTYQPEQQRAETRKMPWHQPRWCGSSTLAGSQRMSGAREDNIVIFIFVGIAADTVFFQKQPEIDQNQKSKIVTPR
jgi:hypothetical protein